MPEPRTIERDTLNQLIPPRRFSTATKRLQLDDLGELRMDAVQAIPRGHVAYDVKFLTNFLFEPDTAIQQLRQMIVKANMRLKQYDLDETLINVFKEPYTRLQQLTGQPYDDEMLRLYEQLSALRSLAFTEKATNESCRQQISWAWDTANNLTVEQCQEVRLFVERCLQFLNRLAAKNQHVYLNCTVTSANNGLTSTSNVITEHMMVSLAIAKETIQKRATVMQQMIARQIGITGKCDRELEFRGINLFATYDVRHDVMRYVTLNQVNEYAQRAERFVAQYG